MRILTSLAAATMLLLITHPAALLAADAPPTVAQPAQATFWSPITATGLTVLGADDNGEALLTYTWSGTGPGSLTFETNGTNAAKDSRVFFGKAGGYTIQVEIRDGSGQTVTSGFGIHVHQKVETLTVTQTDAAVPTAGSQRFTATATDQFGDPYETGDFISIFNLYWRVTGGGIMNAATGVLQAENAAGGPYIVTATAEGGLEATATFRVVPASHVVVGASADAEVRSGAPTSNFGTATSLNVRAPETTAADTRVSYLRFPLSSVPSGMIAATLRVYGRRPIASNRGLSAYRVADNTWTETGLTFNNRPPAGPRQDGPIEIGVAAQYWELDVLSWVQAEKAAGKAAVNLALLMDHLSTIDAPDTFNSKEAASNRPQLRVSYPDPGFPTVVDPATAWPDVVTGTFTDLSVLGDDDGGQAALTYTWSAVGPTRGPVTFSPNGNNFAKQTRATFSTWDQYDIRCVIRDATGRTVASNVMVRVPQTITTIDVRPNFVIVPVGTSQWFSAYGIDQFGVEIDWGHDGPLDADNFAVSGGGTMGNSGHFIAGNVPGGPHFVTMSFEGVNGTATLRVAETATSTIGPSADAYVRDGSYAGTNFGTATSLVVKSSTGSGNNRITYLRFPLTGIGSNVLSARLRMYGSRPSEILGDDGTYEVSSTSWTETGINWNNKPALGPLTGGSIIVGSTPQYWDWDLTYYIRARRAAGATSVSVAVKMVNNTTISPDTFSSKEASSNKPQLVVSYTTNAGTQPGFVRPASASATTVFGKTVQLSALGEDDGGEAALTYTWELLDTGWGSPVTFSVNGTNSAKDTTVTFTGQGDYPFRVTIRDAQGNAAASEVRVRVEPFLTTIQVTPSTQATDPGGQCVFNARGFDQFGSDMGSVDDPWLPNASWSVSGGGFMNGNLFQAGPTPGGPFTVTASKDGVNGTATVRVAVSFTRTLGPSADAYVRDGASASTNYGTATVLNVKHTAQTGNKRISYLKFPLTGVAPDVTQATLRIYGSRANALAQNTTGVRNGLSNSWTETGITWNNKPATGFFAVGHSQTIGTTPQWYDFNVTDYIREQRAAGLTTVTLSLEMFNEITDGPDTFNSREAASNRPQLVVTSR